MLNEHVFNTTENIFSLRVLSVIASMDPAAGGTSEGVKNSIPELEKLGIRNEVVCLDDPEASFLNNYNFTITALGPGKGPWCYSKRLIPWLHKNLDRFDAVIIQGLWLYPSHAVSKAIKEYRKKRLHNGNAHIRLFIMPHGMLDPYFQKASGRRLKAIRNWLYWKLIEGKVIGSADKMLFTCETELLLAKTTFTPYKPKDEVVVGYGIQEPHQNINNINGAFTALYPKLKGKPYLLFLSRIHEKKGVDILLNAYAEVLSQHHTIQQIPMLVIAGPGLDSLYGKKILGIINASELLQANVILPGMLTGASKWDAYQSCEAFILPSHQENFGIAVVEALACSKPVLISDQVNIYKEITSGGAGIAEPNSVAGTKSLLTKWMEKSKEEKAGMSIRARQCFEENFTINAAATKMSKALIAP